jgi:hypothetical protein
MKIGLLDWYFSTLFFLFPLYKNFNANKPIDVGKAKTRRKTFQLINFSFGLKNNWMLLCNNILPKLKIVKGHGSNIKFYTLLRALRMYKLEIFVKCMRKNLFLCKCSWKISEMYIIKDKNVCILVIGIRRI